MEKYLGKKVWLHIIDPNSKKNLFFNCKIIDVSHSHVTFIDRYGKEITWRRLDVVELKPT
jgi:hypothetical protein